MSIKKECGNSAWQNDKLNISRISWDERVPAYL